MELQQLRYVLAVAETRNFTRAAERCHIVQSALSHQIKALEREIGVTLFARTSRRVELTSAGEAFLPAARASLAAADRAVAEAAAATGEIRGRLVVGVIPTVTAVDVPAILAEFRQAHPAVRIALRTGGSDQFVADIAAGRMDVAVLGLPHDVVPQAVASRALRRERLVAVLSAEHRLVHRRRLCLADLAPETFVDYPARSPARAQSDLAFDSAGLSREVAFEAMDTGLIFGIVRRNLGVTLQSPSVVPDGPELRAIPVADGPVRVEHLAWNDFNPSPAALAFVDLVVPAAPGADLTAGRSAP
ncbi:MAG: LysR family transcriptional regulator [Gordonia sp. (in: high G+C Gram-positive bacteria)]